MEEWTELVHFGAVWGIVFDEERAGRTVSKPWRRGDRTAVVTKLGV
jgi:hypothetical protein